MKKEEFKQLISETKSGFLFLHSSLSAPILSTLTKEQRFAERIVLDFHFATKERLMNFFYEKDLSETVVIFHNVDQNEVLAKKAYKLAKKSQIDHTLFVFLSKDAPYQTLLEDEQIVTHLVEMEEDDSEEYNPNYNEWNSDDFASLVSLVGSGKSAHIQAIKEQMILDVFRNIFGKK